MVKMIHIFVFRFRDFSLEPPLSEERMFIVFIDFIAFADDLTGRLRGCHIPPQPAVGAVGFGLRECHLRCPHGFGLLLEVEILLPQLTRFTLANGRLDHNCSRLRPSDRSSHPLLPHFVTFHRLLKRITTHMG
jgi:hypothetical protein